MESTSSPQAVIRRYLDEQGGTAEATVGHLLTTFQVSPKDQLGRERIVTELAGVGVQLHRPIHRLKEDDQVVLSVAAEVKEPGPGNRPPWAADAATDTPPIVAEASQPASEAEKSGPLGGAPPRGQSPVQQAQVPPGWHPNQHGPGQRYWDGVKWTDRYRDVPQPPKKQRTFLKVMLGVLLGGLLLLGGCVALIGGAADEASKEIDKDQNRNAITNAQAREMQIGSPRHAVEAVFGPPEDTQEGENEGLGRDACTYYNVKGGKVGDQWQFCFEGSGDDAKLRSKNRY